MGQVVNHLVNLTAYRLSRNKTYEKTAAIMKDLGYRMKGRSGLKNKPYNVPWVDNLVVGTRFFEHYLTTFETACINVVVSLLTSGTILYL